MRGERPSAARRTVLLCAARFKRRRNGYCNIVLWPYSIAGGVAGSTHMLGYALGSHSVQLSPMNISLAVVLPLSIMSHQATAGWMTRSDSIINVRWPGAVVPVVEPFTAAGT